MTALTHARIGAMLVIGAENSIAQAGCRPDTHAVIFVPGVYPRRTPSMGGVRRNKAREGTNKPACPEQVFGSPHQGRPEKSIPVGRVNASQEGSAMAASHDATSASPLSLSDLDTSTTEPRVCHTRLAVVLGYKSPHRLSALIARNADEMARYGEISRTARENTDPKGRGRPGTDYWLTEGQALLATVRSDTPNAPDAREQIIRVFMSWRRGAAPTPKPSLPSESLIDDLAKQARRIRDLEEQLARARETARQLAPDIAAIARRDSLIAQLEHRDAQLLTIIERLSHALGRRAAP